ncbi:hypothetical protein UlMin_046281 [Ulmus minor]
MLFASMVAGTLASREWRFGFNHTNWRHQHHGRHHLHHHNQNKTNNVAPAKIIVGGSQTWRFNFSYSSWAFKHGPFYLNDTLVFKYDAPSNSSHPHNVYLLPDLRSFINCDFSNARLLADTDEGAGNGFEFVLDRWQPYYFACGASNGYHCGTGRMKFVVVPRLRRGWHG